MVRKRITENFIRGKKRILKEVSKIREFRFRFLNLHLLIVSLVLILAFVGFELFLRTYDLYFYYPWVDVPSHFLAGFAFAALAVWLLHFSKRRYQNSEVMVSVLVLAIFWEILETLQELIIPNPPHLVDIFFWDGFWDVIMTLIGGYVFIKLFDKVIKMKIMRRVKKEIH